MMSLLIAGSMVVSLIIVALPTGRAPDPTPSPVPFPTITLPPPPTRAPTEPALEPTAAVIGPDLPTATPTITATVIITATPSSSDLYGNPEVQGSMPGVPAASGIRFWQRSLSRGG